jgi:hypothetical protein
MRVATKQGRHLELGMVDVFDLYLVVDGVPQKA